MIIINSTKFQPSYSPSSVAIIIKKLHASRPLTRSSSKKRHHQQHHFSTFYFVIISHALLASTANTQ
jgi:hypothetical protein